MAIFNNDQPVIMITLPATAKFPGDHVLPIKKVVAHMPMPEKKSVKDNQGIIYANHWNIESSEDQRFVVTFEALDGKQTQIVRDSSLSGTQLLFTQVATSANGRTQNGFMTDPATSGTPTAWDDAPYDITYSGNIVMSDS